MAAMNKGAISAMINAAKRAQTLAGWRSVQPFVALAPASIALLTADADSAPDLLNLPLPEVDSHDDDSEPL